MQSTNTTGGTVLINPLDQYPKPPYSGKTQTFPGSDAAMDPKADHGEESYKGSGKLAGRKAVITGADSGIGRAVAIAFAREGADVLISYLSEDADAKETARWVEAAGRKAVLVAGDIQDEAHCKKIIDTAVKELGGVDILVNNAAYEQAQQSIQDITADQLDRTFRTNVYAMFYLCKAAEPHLPPGSSVINTTSVNAYVPKPVILDYAATKGAIQNFTANLGQAWAEKGIRVNCVAPGPVWTPFIPSSLDSEAVKKFGADVPLKRAGQPAELAGAYVLLASKEGSYMTSSTIQVTGGTPTI